MIDAIVGAITDWVDAFITLIVDVFTNLTPIFWTPGVSPDPGELTLVGVLALMSVAVGLIYLGLRFIMGLFPGANRL